MMKKDRQTYRIYTDSYYLIVKAAFDFLLWTNGISKIFEKNWLAFRKDPGDTNIDEYFSKNYPDDWIKNAFDWNKAEVGKYFKCKKGLDYWQGIQNKWLPVFWDMKLPAFGDINKKSEC